MVNFNTGEIFSLNVKASCLLPFFIDYRNCRKMTIRTQHEIERRGNKMAEAVRSGKKELLDEKIEKFCENSTELLKNIHERCCDTAGGSRPGKNKRGRKKAKKE